ncbi:hypothetical protein GOP47_0000637 [Adiantum capillus-veneris]|uniref:Uncharacterized protein n=1 Tax=Adiantum capillus-veneris TaxID=13818 RepID=A0A9D4VFC5_ADICA|nr:hypothetical protein GOP47_0000637 [Adiantum capillus-veneris]
MSLEPGPQGFQEVIWNGWPHLPSICLGVEFFDESSHPFSWFFVMKDFFALPLRVSESGVLMGDGCDGKHQGSCTGFELVWLSMAWRMGDCPSGRG